jgi:hypothetical protein
MLDLSSGDKRFTPEAGMAVAIGSMTNFRGEQTAEIGECSQDPEPLE